MSASRSTASEQSRSGAGDKPAAAPSRSRARGKAATEICRSGACDKPAAGRCPLSGVALCRLHLNRDIAKVQEQKARLVERLQLLRESADRQQLRLEQQMLATEIQEVQDMFDALQEKVQQWRVRTVSRVQAMHDSVARRLRDAAEAEECEKEVSVAWDAGDMTKVVELTATMEPLVDVAFKRSVKFDRDRSEHQKRQGSDSSNLRSVGDVAGGVQQLQFVIDRHMADVMQRCWLEEAMEDSMGPPLCVIRSTIADLEGEPFHVTCCTNIDGFYGDSSGRVVKAKPSTKRSVPLPQPCIFVSFPSKCVDHLLVTSVDGAVRLRCHSNLDFSKWIIGLYCDSSRQLMFVAQPLSVSVMNLCGDVMRVMNGTSLKLQIRCVSAICGNADNVFLLDSILLKVFAISKETGQLESTLDVSAFDMGGLNRLTMCGSKILLVDWKVGRVLKVCSVTGQLIASYPKLAIAQFECPYQVAVESRGIMFISERTGHSVRAVSGSGEILQTLGVPGRVGNGEGHLYDPRGLSVVQDEDRQLLVVADRGNVRLRVYQIE